MRATTMHGAGDVRIESVPDATLVDSTDALIRVVRASICGSDLWPYASMEPRENGQSMGHEALDGHIDPGRVLDRTVDLDGVPDGYRAMADREAIKVMVRP